MTLNGLKAPLLSAVLGVMGGLGSAIWYTADERATVRERMDRHGGQIHQVEQTLRERQTAVTKLEVVEQRIAALETANVDLRARVARCEARLFGMTSTGGDGT